MIKGQTLKLSKLGYEPPVEAKLYNIKKQSQNFLERKSIVNSLYFNLKRWEGILEVLSYVSSLKKCTG